MFAASKPDVSEHTEFEERNSYFSDSIELELYSRGA
jgi:hypothetical protein